MNPVLNPFSPGAGTPPPELAGRDKFCETVRIAIERARNAMPAKSVIMVGLRGVGKTVLLDRMRDSAEAAGICCLRIEARENRSLPSLLAPQLRQALLKLSRKKQAEKLALQALRGLAGFVKALKVKYHDIEMAVDIEPAPGIVDNGDLEHDLQDLVELAGRAAAPAGTALAIFIDELQYVAEDDLAALITALHRAAQRKLPVIMVGAGLPQLRGRMGDAKSYAERLFDFPDIGPLPPDAARIAIEKPLHDQNIKIAPAATALIIANTNGYPYFIQEWGKQVWDTAESSPIKRADVEQATDLVLAALDESFFRVRFDRLTPIEKKYLRAMAQLGPGPFRSGEIAAAAGREVAALAPVRYQLISKGMIWSPSHGETAFTVPLFDSFMRRIMPASPG